MIRSSSSSDEENVLLSKNPTDAKSNDSSCMGLSCKKIRYFFGFLSLLGLINALMMRSCLSVAIVDMVTAKNRTIENPSIVKYKDFNWSHKDQGIALSSFFWGYVSFQIPGAILTYKFGGRKVFGFGVLVQSVLGMFIPCIKHFGGWHLLLAIRVFQGLSEGVVYPSIIDFLSKWTPQTERSAMYTFVFSGNYIGVVCGMLLTGYIIDLWNWQAAFVCISTCGILWFFIWQFFVTDLPEDHALVTTSESEYIKSTRKTDGTTLRQLKDIPTKKILLSKPVWAIAIAMFAESWGQYTIMAEFPTYLSNIYNVSIYQSGLYSGLPYLFMVIFLYIGGTTSDFLQRKNIMPVSFLRKAFVTFGFGFQMLFVFLLICATTLDFSVVFVCLALALGSFTIAGFGPNILDLSPNYAGAVLSLINTVANLGSLLAPLVCGILISSDSYQWGTVFSIVIAIQFFGGLFFVILGSSHPQDWD